MEDDDDDDGKKRRFPFVMSVDEQQEQLPHHNEVNLRSPDVALDLYRDTPIRLLGYANEVGEAFRSMIPLSLVRLSYAVASCYCIADTLDKSLQMKRRDWSSTIERNKMVTVAGFDTLVWQALASVIIPGYTINRACAISLYAMSRWSRLSPKYRLWATTAIGLSCIPFIVKPIDHSVDYIMDKTLRKFYEQIV